MAMTTTEPTRPQLAQLRWPVRTERLSLRPATWNDLAPTWEFRRRDDVAQWLTRAPATISEYRPLFLDRTSLAKSLVIELDGHVIGDLMLAVEDAWGQAEVAEEGRGAQADLGWVLHPDHGGRGYGTEAVRELLRIAFKDLGVRRVTANCFTDNVPSWRLMERVGMRRETHAVQDALHRSGQWMDSYVYALLDHEYIRTAIQPGQVRS
jgi:RimJ/RimL family protein N-acetyltransferase